MKIDIWSDFACPFCYIGEKHLEQALGGREDVEVIFHSFELDPSAPPCTKEDVYTNLAGKYGISLAQAKAQCDSIELLARAAGLAFNLAGIKLANTFNAHRLAQFAKAQGMGKAFVDEGFRAFLCEGRDFSDGDELLRLAVSAGLDEGAAKLLLQSDEYEEEVRADEQLAAEMGIHSVPFFVFDGRLSLSGAQPAEAFQQILERCELPPSSS